MTDQCRRCEGCERDHCECLIQRMADEIELLSNELKAERTLNRITCEMDEACCQCRWLRDDIERLRGAMRADDDRLMTAGVRVGIVFGCDTAEAMADEIERLRAQVETLEWQLTMESIDTTKESPCS